LDPEFVEKETAALKAEVEKQNEELKRLGKTLKHVPKYASRLQLTDEVLAEAKKELEEALKAQGKPEKIWDRIIPGQMERFIADNTLLDQELTLLSQFYVMDDKKTVEQVLEEKSKEFGGKIEIVEYVRFELGEGLEKKGCDFASEVAEQLK
jgi:elongation factor Ts